MAEIDPIVDGRHVDGVASQRAELVPAGPHERVVDTRRFDRRRRAQRGEELRPVRVIGEPFIRDLEPYRKATLRELLVEHELS